MIGTKSNICVENTRHSFSYDAAQALSWFTHLEHCPTRFFYDEIICTCLDLESISKTILHDISQFNGYNPNAVHPITHWGMHDLVSIYVLRAIKIWNMNTPDYLDYRLKDIVIDYFLDGLAWEEYGSCTLPI